MAIGGGKSSSNHTRTMEGAGTELELTTNRESYFTLAASSGMNDTKSDYTESSENSPASSENRTELAAQLHGLD